MQQAINFTPPGMISAFNAWGNHPDNMRTWISQNMRPAFERLGISKGYAEAEKILFDALDDIAARASEFCGYYEPTSSMKKVLYDFLMKYFIKPEECKFYGKDNYLKARELTEQGKNVLFVQNHTSPLDALVPFTLIRQHFPGSQLPAIIMSQVFEYARITGIITSGVHKFPVFQPKHMRKFAEGENSEVVAEMKRQNSIALQQLLLRAKKGGEMIFLYPERDRNSSAMGVPEPKAMKVVRLLASAGPDLYLMPTFITGLQTIFPNRPGTNELDIFFDLIQVGQGDFYCGEPVCIGDVFKKASVLDSSVIEKVLGEVPEDLSDAALSVTILTMIAALAPDRHLTGVYSNL